MSTTQNPAPEAPATATATEAAPKAGRRSRPPREPTAPVDPAVEEMRAHVIANVGAPAAAPEEDATAIFTLEQLVERYGVATIDEANAYLEGETLEQLTADGAGVATPRLTRDGARIWGTIATFFLRATPAQRAHVPAITDDFLRTGIWCNYQGHLAYTAMRTASATIATERAGRATDSDLLRRLGGERRDVLHGGLRVIVGRRGGLRTQVEKAYSGNNRPADIAITIRALVRIGHQALADNSPTALQRRRGSLITAEFLTESEALAAMVETRGQEAAAVLTPPAVVQADVDLWDGRNLALLALAIDAFETGHAIDPSIPRLVPISLRTWLGRRRRERKARPAPGTTTTPPAPPSTAAAPSPSPATPPSPKPAQPAPQTNQA